MDRLTITQRIKIIKIYYKNGDDGWMGIFRKKFSSAKKHILDSVGPKNPQVIKDRPLHREKITVW